MQLTDQCKVGVSRIWRDFGTNFNEIFFNSTCFTVLSIDGAASALWRKNNLWLSSHELTLGNFLSILQISFVLTFFVILQYYIIFKAINLLFFCNLLNGVSREMLHIRFGNGCPFCRVQWYRFRKSCSWYNLNWALSKWIKMPCIKEYK